MKNLKNEGLKTLETKVRSIKSWRLLFALVLVAPLAALSAVGPTPLALADSGGVKGHTFNVTFTKWVTSQPASPPSVAGVSMLGVVGGAVGEGRFAGYVYSDDLSVPGLEVIHARTVIPVCSMATPGNVFGTMCIPGTLQIHRGGDSEE